MKYALFKVKEGRLDQWRRWCSLLMDKNAYYDQAYKSVLDEGLITEAFFTFQLDDTWYALGCGAGEDKPADPNLEVNKLHKQMKQECLEFITKGQADYSFVITEVLK